jgi:hypothetical protein
MWFLNHQSLDDPSRIKQAVVATFGYDVNKTILIGI